MKAGEENLFTRKEPVAQNPSGGRAVTSEDLPQASMTGAMKVKEPHFTCGQRSMQSGHGRF